MATTRTRQRSVKEFFAPATFDQSPMKAARRAGRTQSGSSSQAQARTWTEDVGEESEDPILLSPRSRAKGKKKRGVSPESEDGERKRPKLDDKEAARAIFGGTKIREDDGPPGPRATSVPADGYARSVDLTRIASPRRRSPVRSMLRYTSEPADVRDMEVPASMEALYKLEAVAEEQPPVAHSALPPDPASPTSTPRERKRPRSPSSSAARSSPASQAERFAASVRASNILDSMFGLDEVPAQFTSPALALGRRKSGEEYASPAVAKSWDGEQRTKAVDSQRPLPEAGDTTLVGETPMDEDGPDPDDDAPMSDLTGLDDLSELTEQSENEDPPVTEPTHDEHRTPVAPKRGRGGPRGRGRGAARAARGGAPPTARGRGTLRAPGVTRATATRGRRGIPRAVPSTSRLTRSSSTRTVDSAGTVGVGSQETTGKGKEKEVEIVRDAGDVGGDPSSSVRVLPKTPVTVSVELPAEGSKTPGPFVRPKTPAASNARSTASDASFNAAPPKRTGGFAAPTASSLSKTTRSSPTKKPAPCASSPTKPAASSSSSSTTPRPPLQSKSSLSSLSNLNAVLERARAQTSMGFNRDVTRPAGVVRSREDLPDRLDASLEAQDAKGKEKLPAGQTMLGLKPKTYGAGPSKIINGAGPSSRPNGITTSTLMRTTSLGALGRGPPPAGGMKQATLPFAKPAAPRAAGFPNRRMHVSLKPGLGTVKGSPVKGGAMAEADEDEDEDEPLVGKGKGRVPGIEPMDLFKAGESALADSDDDDDDDAPGFSTVIGPVTPASRVHAGWEKNASRRASLASQALLALQTQAQSPGTPPESERARSTRSGGAVQPNPAAGVPRVLKHCSVYVDVRGPDGDDQGSWFVDTLKILGARVQTRLGSACTHIVFRGGAAQTLQRYAQMPDPKPAVVGVGWVVACAEQVQEIDTRGFLVDVATASAEAVLREKAPQYRKRRSTVPMNLSVSPIAPGKVPGFVGGEREEGEGDELPRTGGSRVGREEDITPLERARRRREAMEAANKAGK